MSHADIWGCSNRTALKKRGTKWKQVKLLMSLLRELPSLFDTCPILSIHRLRAAANHGIDRDKKYLPSTVPVVSQGGWNNTIYNSAWSSGYISASFPRSFHSAKSSRLGFGFCLALRHHQFGKRQELNWLNQTSQKSLGQAWQPHCLVQLPRFEYSFVCHTNAWDAKKMALCFPHNACHAHATPSRRLSIQDSWQIWMKTNLQHVLQNSKCRFPLASGFLKAEWLRRQAVLKITACNTTSQHVLEKTGCSLCLQF